MTNKKEKRKKITEKNEQEIQKEITEDKVEITEEIQESIQNKILEEMHDKSQNESQENIKEEIVVYAEICKNKDSIEFPHPVTYELLNTAKSLSGKYYSISVLYPGENLDEKTAKSFFKEGADKIYHIKNDRQNNPECLIKGLIDIIKEKKPSIVLIGATQDGRLIAPIISNTLKTGLTADCTKLDIIDFKEEKKLAATRPTFGGQLMATILCKTKPQMVTVRPNVLIKQDIVHNEEGEIEICTPDTSCIKDRIKLIDAEDRIIKYIDLEGAKIVVSGGAGLKNKEGFDKLKTFAALIGASIAGTRRAVDMKLIEKDFQVGQTGKTIAPEVYFAFGISGAIHHISGMQNSRTVIAVNTDSNAPIFEHADYGITKDAIQVLDELIANYQK